MIYLDNAATTKMTKQVLDTYMTVASTLYGNSASLHDEGGRSQAIISKARMIVANKLGVHMDGIIFTGSGTEGNILAILSLAHAAKKGKHIITSMAEHTSVHAAMNTLEREGYEITKLNFTAEGIVDIKQLRKSIRPDTVLISIQHVNSEMGSIQPVEEIIRIANEMNVFSHVDCVQSFCKLPIEKFAKQVDAITISAHKVGGPKGCGAVYLNPKIHIEPLFPGVTHERGLRGGTLDTPAIAAMASAIESFQYSLDNQLQLRLQLMNALKEFPITWIEAKPINQLPSICGLCIKGIEGQYVLLRLNEEDIYISTGSACDINSASGTKAILAMNRSMSEARQFFRISFSSATTSDEIKLLAKALSKISYEI